VVHQVCVCRPYHTNDRFPLPILLSSQVVGTENISERNIVELPTFKYSGFLFLGEGFTILPDDNGFTLIIDEIDYLPFLLVVLRDGVEGALQENVVNDI
jgi:hypothetical protein